MRRACELILPPLLAALWLASPAGQGEEFPARDSHQGVTIAARAVLATPEAERIFGAKAALTRAGFLAVELLIVNDREEAIEINLERIWVVGLTDRFEQAEPATIAWRLFPPPRPKKPIDSTRLPTRLPKDKHRAAREEAEASLRRAQLRAAVIPPRSRARGYRYFDRGDRSFDPATGTVYLPEVRTLPGGEALLFFEIPLAPPAESGSASETKPGKP